MNFQKTKVIFFNTIQKEFRNKVFLFLFVMTILGILLATVISNYVFKNVVPPEATAFVGDKTLDMIFAIIQFWTLIVAMILGSNCIKSDFENNNIISQLISLPIKRVEFLSARILGTWAITSFYYLFSYLVALVSFSAVAGSYVGSWGILSAFVYTGLATLGVIGLSVFLSFGLPKLFGFVCSFIAYIFIVFSNSAMRGEEVSTLISEGLSVGDILALMGHYLLPRLGDLSSLSQSMLLGIGVPEKLNIPMTIGHFALSFAALYLVLSFIFQKKDI